MNAIRITLATLLLSQSILAQGGWTKIQSSSGNPVTTFTSPGIYKGAAWVDVNNDGNTDLFAMPNFLFINQGNGVFTHITNAGINPAPLQNPGGCSWADINNDGFTDFITAQNPSEIYINNGNSTFNNITSQLSSLNGYASWGCALADVNNDNQLDLFYAQAFGFHGAAFPYPCRFYIQNSSGGFNMQTGYACTDSVKPYTVPYFHDYDLDGDMDLFIATGPGGSPGPDYCYKNLKVETGLDTLIRMSAEPWTTQLQDGQCYNFIDYDNDGDLDLCLTNYAGASTRFYRNDGGGNYTALTTPFTVTLPFLSNSWGDFDNDGDLDVIIASDNAPLKYFNNTNGVFTLTVPSLTVPASNSAVISCDYDNDGDLDLFIHGDNSARSLWRNDSVATGNHFVSYTLKGTVSNSSAIGAVIKIKAFINGVAVWQMRQVTAQNSFQGQNDLRVHFGLGDGTLVDSLIIHWLSGIKECYTLKPVDVFATLIEGNGTPLNTQETEIHEGLKIYPNPSHGIFTISGEVNGTLNVFADSGKKIMSSSVNGQDREINLTGQKPGAYIAVIQQQGLSRCYKLIIR